MTIRGRPEVLVRNALVRRGEEAAGLDEEWADAGLAFGLREDLGALLGQILGCRPLADGKRAERKSQRQDARYHRCDRILLHIHARLSSGTAVRKNNGAQARGYGHKGVVTLAQ